MSKSVKEVASLSGVSEKTVRRWLADHDLAQKMPLNRQGGYLIPDEVANEIKEAYKDKIIAKEQLLNHKNSQIKNAREIIFSSLVERDLKGSHPKTDKQLLWLAMMILDKLDDVNKTTEDVESNTDSSETHLSFMDSSLDEINDKLETISDQLDELINIFKKDEK